MFDLIIIGGSAAGSSAAIYAARRNLNFKMVTFDVGGEVALSGVVNNWPGIIEIQGFELAQKFNDHVKSYGVQIDTGYKVEKIISEKNYHTVVAKDGADKEQQYQTKTVIIATGIHPRQLGVPGEKEFDRKGVTYCTVCDGPLFKNKITATVGSGNSALESAIMMAGIAKKVYLISKFTNTQADNFGFPKGENILIDKLKTFSNVEIIYSAATTEILGEKSVTGLKFTANGAEKIIDAQGVMVHIGQIPNSQFIDSVKKNKINEIMVDGKCQTNIPGILAAGDVTDVAYKQIGISAGQGITSALAAIEYINRWN
ncbi:MAG: FAD-dependent oxidoreductase [Candidatus Magasanikbacteria bacterium]|nr:FAD-dependent oxidoreductase [Candidatus Magasanikbacteria bacterium]